jgi:hypothetical protein
VSGDEDRPGVGPLRFWVPPHPAKKADRITHKVSKFSSRAFEASNTSLISAALKTSHLITPAPTPDEKIRRKFNGYMTGVLDVRKRER